jgi:type III pantothenate kinase
MKKHLEFNTSLNRLILILFIFLSINKLTNGSDYQSNYHQNLQFYTTEPSYKNPHCFNVKQPYFVIDNHFQWSINDETNGTLISPQAHNEAAPSTSIIKKLTNDQSLDLNNDYYPENPMYTLCIDIGNSHIHAGFHNGQSFSSNFRLNTHPHPTPVQIGQAFTAFLKDHKIPLSNIQAIFIASVVPSLNTAIEQACLEFLQVKPLFITYKNITQLSFQYPIPEEIGADLLCSAIGATHLFPKTPLIIVDMGTATTLTAVDENQTFITGLIFPGLKTQLKSLCQSAEQLDSVPLIKPPSIIGLNTTECVQNGLYYSHLGALKYTCQLLGEACFSKKPYKIIATGGLAHLFNEAPFFDYYEPNLVLLGLLQQMTVRPLHNGHF